MAVHLFFLRGSLVSSVAATLSTRATLRSASPLSGLTHQDGTETEAWTNFKKTASAEDVKYVENVLSSIEVKGKAKANE